MKRQMPTLVGLILSMGLLTTCASTGFQVPPIGSVSVSSSHGFPRFVWQDLIQAPYCTNYRLQLQDIERQSPGLSAHIRGTWLLCAIGNKDFDVATELAHKLLTNQAVNTHWHMVSRWAIWLSQYVRNSSQITDLPLSLPLLGGEVLARGAVEQLVAKGVTSDVGFAYQRFPHWHYWPKEVADNNEYSFTTTETFNIAKKLVRYGQRELAWRHLSRLWNGINSKPWKIDQWWPVVDVADRYWFSGLAFDLRRYETAERVAKKLYKQDKTRGQALLTWGRALARQSKGVEAEKVWLQYRENVNGSEYWLRITYRLGLLAEDIGHIEQAQDYYRAAAQESFETGEREHAAFRAGWLSYLRGDMASAYQDWSTQLTSTTDYVAQRRLLYWSAQASTDPSDHISELYKEAPLSFYAWQHRQLHGVARPDPATDTAHRWQSFVTQPASSLPASFTTIEQLAQLGLLPPAQVEFSQAITFAGDDAQRVLALQMGAHLNLAYEALLIFWRYYEDDYRQAPPYFYRDLWKIVYPAPYKTEIQQAAQRFGVPVGLLFAIMREESRFRSSVISPAGAVGLLQLMPATAARTAQKFGLDYSGSYSLTQSAINIPIAAAFIQTLLESYDGNLVYAIASYNAGSGAVNRWRKRFAGLPQDAFVEEIPYAETRRYVAKVLRSYVRYNALYGLD